MIELLLGVDFELGSDNLYFVPRWSLKEAAQAYLQLDDGQCELRPVQPCSSLVGIASAVVVGSALHRRLQHRFLFVRPLIAGAHMLGRVCEDCRCPRDCCGSDFDEVVDRSKMTSLMPCRASKQSQKLQ
jgi:hypothetical protein